MSANDESAFLIHFRNIIDRLVDEYDEETTGDYPLVMAGAQWKKFRGSFGDFIIVSLWHMKLNCAVSELHVVVSK